MSVDESELIQFVSQSSLMLWCCHMQHIKIYTFWCTTDDANEGRLYVYSSHQQGVNAPSCWFDDDEAGYWWATRYDGGAKLYACFVWLALPLLLFHLFMLHCNLLIFCFSFVVVAVHPIRWRSSTSTDLTQFALRQRKSIISTFPSIAAAAAAVSARKLPRM